jgi:DNA-binding beta-propeller fold protein YncE
VRSIHATAALLIATLLPSSQSAAWGQKFLYWTDNDGGRIQRLNLDAHPSSEVETLIQGLSDPRGIAVDAVGGKVYWAENGVDKIRRANLDGSGIEDLVTDFPDFPADLEVDPAGGKVYWADTNLNSIWRANLDGSDVDLFVPETNLPYFFTLDLVGRNVYWSENFAGVIHRTSIDAPGDIDDVVTGLVRVRDIAVDTPAGRIYWNDRNSHKIQTRDLAGAESIIDLFDGSDGLDEPHGLALDDGFLYWADTDPMKISRGRVNRADFELLVGQGLDNPWDVAIANIVVPEPGAISLLAVTVAGLLGRRRR